MKFTFPPESKPLEGYTIKRAIGRGGFGEVYYALSDAGKEVALKLLVQNMDVELRGVSQCLNLKHPNLVTIFDIKQDHDNDHWIVMEYVSGKSLDDILEQVNGPMPLERVKFWLSGIVAGLSFLHDRGIVHRDLKPANVYNENDLVKIGDVGLAKYISQSRRNAQTESVGTVYYMAPEVAHGQYGHEVDVYSTGIVLYEMLTGKLPFDGESTGEILMKHLTEKPDLAPVPPQFHSVVSRALEKDPQKRTPSISQLGSEFEQALAGNSPKWESSPEPEFKAGHQNGTSFENEQASLEGVPKLKHHAKEFGKEAEKYARQFTRDAQSYAKKMAKNAQEYAEQQKKAHGEWTEKHKKPQRSPEKYPRHKTTHSSFFEDKPALKVIVAIMAILLMGSILGIRPAQRMFETSFVLCIYGALIYGTYRFIAWLFGWGKTAETTLDYNHPGTFEEYPVHQEPLQKEQAEAVVNFQVEKKPKKGYHRKRKFVYYGPSTLRHTPADQKFNSLIHSMLYSLIISTIITGCLFASGFLTKDFPVAVAFGLTTLLCSWTIMIPAKIWDGAETDSTTKRVVQMSLGAVLGLAVYLLHRFLNINILYSQFDTELYAKAVDSWGAVKLYENFQPTMMAFILFFAGLFFLQRWWLQADSFRKKRFRIRTVLGSFVFAVIGSVLVLSSSYLPLVWMAATSCIVQLSSEWVPRSKREYVVNQYKSEHLA